MQKLFNYNSTETFWQSFSEDVELFKQKTKELSRNDLLKLTEEPGETSSHHKKTLNLIEFKFLFAFHLI